MRNEIVYKKAKADDAEKIASMQKQLYDMIGFDGSLFDNGELVGFLRTEIQNGGYVCYLATENDSIVGGICINFSDSISHEGIEYNAAIPLLYVDDSYRNGAIALDLFKIALKECKAHGLNNLCMSVEDNNPNKFLHFAVCDKLIDLQQEVLDDDKTVDQYILGISNIDSVLDMSLPRMARRVVSAKKNFDFTLKELDKNHH